MVVDRRRMTTYPSEVIIIPLLVVTAAPLATHPARGVFYATVLSMVDELRARIEALENALRPFAAIVTFVDPTMRDGREISVTFAKRDEGPSSAPMWETLDALPTVATVGDVRKAARLLGLPERTPGGQ
jgi:hypothetical protein